MKTIKILIISLLLVITQAFAWGKGEQKALLGFTAGVVLTHFISNYDNSSYESVPSKTVYVQEPKEIVYVDSYESHHEFREYKRRYHHRERFAHRNYERRYNRHYYNEEYPRHHHRKHNRVVVQNNYQTNYYY